MASIYNAILDDKELKVVLKPCKNRNYGAYYAILIFAILTSILLCVLAFKGLKFIFKKINEMLEDRAEAQAVVAQQQVKLSRFKEFEKDLFISDNTLFYAVRSYKNTDTKLTMFVDFYVRGAEHQFIKVSDMMDEYLNQQLGYGVPSYRGKSSKLAGTKLLVGMGELYLTQSLTRAYGSDVTVQQIDNELVSF